MFKTAEDSENNSGSQDLTDSVPTYTMGNTHLSHISLPSHIQHSQMVTPVNRVISTTKD